MGFDLEGAAGYFRWTSSGWLNIFELATKNGWEPTGTGPPKGTLKCDWEGSYFANTGQLFYARDAKNIAAALEEELKNQPKPQPKKKKKQQIEQDWLFSPEGQKSLRQFIKYCRKRSFRIY